MLVLLLNLVSVISAAVDTIDQACSIYCTGDILTTIQLSGIYNDSKTFPDMPMKFDPDVVQASFNNIVDKHDINQLRQFLNENFDEAGSDLMPYSPPDLQEHPAFLDYIENDDYRQWASELNQRWNSLGKQLTADVASYPQRHSFVPINYPMIVPGGRFRESYYWDSWWILKGLLVCDMVESAMNIVNILLDQVNEFGFVPNGGRIYYLDRSQPPVLSEMILDLCVYYQWNQADANTDAIATLLATAVPLLEKEYNWWMDPVNKHIVSGLTSQQQNNAVSAAAQSGSDSSANSDGSVSAATYTLNRYHSNGTTPRPESYVEDSEDGDTATFWRNVRTGAETGWDFSSRWIGGDGHSVRNIVATEIVPVDLNAILLKYEKNMILILTYMANNKLLDASTGTILSTGVVVKNNAAFYAQAAAQRKTAMNAVLWDEDAATWVDYNISSTASSSSTKKANTVASITPIWAGIIDIHPDDSLERRTRLYNAFMDSGLVQEGGVLTTTEVSGQQWDAPNAWPPMVWFTIQVMVKLALPQSIDAARNISSAWLASCFIGYNATGSMYEKYDAYHPGSIGAGGEYLPQEGFGWTNGVVLYLLNHSLQLPFEPAVVVDDAGPNIYNDTNVTIFVLCFVAMLVCCVGFYEYRRKIVLPEYYVRRNRELSSCDQTNIDVKKVQEHRSKYLYSNVMSSEDDDHIINGAMGNPPIGVFGDYDNSNGPGATLLTPLYPPSDANNMMPRPQQYQQHHQQQQHQQQQYRTPEKVRPASRTSTGAGVAVFARSNTYTGSSAGYGNSNVATPMTPSAAARQYRFPRSNTNTPAGDNSMTNQFYRSPPPKFAPQTQLAVQEAAELESGRGSESTYDSR